MKKLTIIIILAFCSSVIYAQTDFFVFKKRNKTTAIFMKGSYIAFQTETGEWFTGNITHIHKDSFYIRPMVVRYHLMGTDTAHYDVLPFTLAEVFAMPKKGVQIDFINGRFQITRSGGHVKWYWVKSGWIFRTGGAGYIILNIINGIAQNNFSISDPNLKIAAGFFLFGKLLKYLYKPVLLLGKKYRLQSVTISK